MAFKGFGGEGGSMRKNGFQDRTIPKNEEKGGGGGSREIF